jgi:P4 family phage/plasmid primase-like protien
MRGRAPWECGIAKANGAVYNLIDHVQRNGGTVDGAPQQATFAMPERIRTGERNDALFRYGCSLRHRGYPDDAIDAMMRRANAERCDEPMAEGELRSVIRQVCRYGAGHDGQGTMRGEDVGVGAPGRSGGEGDVPPFRTDRGRIRHNLLARIILDRNRAQHIDGSLAVWYQDRWQWGREAVDAVATHYADDIKVAERNEVYGYLRTKAPHVTTDRDFDHRWYVQFSNGTYDVLGGRTVDPTPDMLITATLPVELDLDAPYGDADRFIESLAAGDEATCAVLREIVGACMCSRRVVSQAPMLIGRAPGGGTAANGKSTYINVLRTLLGPGNVSSLDIATLGQRFQAGRLVGRLANLGDDIPDGFLRGDELSLFKKLVTGDEIYTDVKNGQGFEFRPGATMVFSMNAMPRLADSTEGVFRRLAFVPFRAQFMPGSDGCNPHMAEEMARPENLRRLALLGLMELPALIERGTLTPIPDMVAEVEEIRRENDVVRRWAYSQMVTDEQLAGEWVEDAFERFTRWCESAHEHYTISQATFTKRALAVFGRLETYETRDRAINRRGLKFRWPESEVVAVKNDGQ